MERTYVVDSINTYRNTKGVQRDVVLRFSVIRRIDPGNVRQQSEGGQKVTPKQKGSHATASLVAFVVVVTVAAIVIVVVPSTTGETGTVTGKVVIFGIHAQSHVDGQEYEDDAKDGVHQVIRRPRNKQVTKLRTK